MLSTESRFEALYNHTIQMTNDRPIHRLNYRDSIHFNWPMVGLIDVIFYKHYKKILKVIIEYDEKRLEEGKNNLILNLA